MVGPGGTLEFSAFSVQAGRLHQEATTASIVVQASSLQRSSEGTNMNSAVEDSRSLVQPFQGQI